MVLILLSASTLDAVPFLPYPLSIRHNPPLNPAGDSVPQEEAS